MLAFSFSRSTGAFPMCRPVLSLSWPISRLVLGSIVVLFAFATSLVAQEAETTSQTADDYVPPEQLRDEHEYRGIYMKLRGFGKKAALHADKLFPQKPFPSDLGEAGRKAWLRVEGDRTKKWMEAYEEEEARLYSQVAQDSDTPIEELYDITAEGDAYGWYATPDKRRRSSLSDEDREKLLATTRMVRAHYRQERREEARLQAAAKAAAEKVTDEKKAKSLLSIAKSLEKQGLKPQAVEWYRRIVREFPGAQSSELASKRLEEITVPPR